MMKIMLMMMMMIMHISMVGISRDESYDSSDAKGISTSRRSATPPQAATPAHAQTGRRGVTIRKEWEGAEGNLNGQGS